MTDGPILYIEDEEDYQLLVKKILGRAGLEVVTADTGAEGLEMLRQSRPSLLILDINLPDTDGYTICAQLRRDPVWVDLPILMLTVRRRPEEWLRGFASGANDYISKPLNPPELVERVVNGLEGRSGQNSTREGSPEYKLVQAAASGNRAAFEILIQQYKTRLVDGMRANGHSPAVAEDIVSSTFLKAYKNMLQFRGEASFYTWLYRIALNTAKEYFTRAGNVSLDELTANQESRLPEHLGAEDRVHNDLSEADSARRAQDALRLVPEPYREMLNLYFMDSLTYDAVAKKLDIPIGTVMSRLHKGRQLLQEAWEKRNTAV
jgi:RNA polymerase sigma-70 factor (ECF subfamily)